VDDEYFYSSETYVALVDYGSGADLEPAASLEEVTDDTATITIDVPTAWDNRRTAPVLASDGTEYPTIVAAPNLADLEGPWDGPGLLVQYWPNAVRYMPDLIEWLEAVTDANVPDCEIERSVPISDGAAERQFGECGTTGAGISYRGFNVGGTLDRILVGFQYLRSDTVDDYLLAVFGSVELIDR